MKNVGCSSVKGLTFGVTVCLLIAGQVARGDFVFSEPTLLGPTVNTSAGAYFNSISADGLELYFASQDDLYVTTRATANDAWDKSTNLGTLVNSATYDGAPCLSGDGLSLYFDSMRSGGYGPADIWVTRRASKSDPWGAPENLGVPVNTSGDEGFPAISSDGLELYFADFDPIKPGGQGGRDLWMTNRSSISDTWEQPVNAGAIVNSSSHDIMPSLSMDGRILLFTSRRPGGYDERDIWLARRATINDPWGVPVNAGPTINTSTSDQSATLSMDGSTLYFTSMRPGGPGNLNIWQAPVLPVVDLNGDGKIDGGDICAMVDYWGTDDSLCDIGPMPWGDGVVDVEDVKILAKFIGKDVDDPALAAHWKLDEAAGMSPTDSVGNHNGVALGAPVWQPNGGQVGGALEFDGVDDHIVTDFVLNPADGPFSVLAWIRGGAPGQVIVSQVDGVNWLMADALEGTLATELSPPAGRTPIPPLVSESLIADDDWHRVAFVWDGFTRSLHMDGTLAAQDEQSSLAECRGTLNIGCGPAHEQDTLFSGLIDDVRIYNRAVRP